MNIKHIKIIHPIFFAIFPIIFLYAFNISELNLLQITLPLVIAVISVTIFWIILNIVLRDRISSGIITSVFVLIFYLYDNIYNFIARLGITSLKHRHILPTCIFIGIYMSYFIHMYLKEDAKKNISKIMDFIAITIVITNLISIIPKEVNKQYTINKSKNINVVNYSNSAENKNMPDIYYIILDEFASLDTINNIWEYDNKEFVDFLTEKEFYIASKSESRYIHTYKSLAASLNMQYLDINENLNDFEYLNDKKLNEDIKVNIYSMIGNNEVSSYLRARGYEYIYISNNYQNGRFKVNADRVFSYKASMSNYKSYIDDFLALLIENTAIKPFSFVFESKIVGNYSAVKYQLNMLNSMPEFGNNPKFVFIHLMSPHAPFVFDENGAYVEKNHYNWEDKKYYLDQYKYICKRIEETVTELLLKSNTQPIIVIQSDHGPRGTYWDDNSANGVIPLEHMKKVFNAYYLPNFDYKNINDNISPVNTFRLIFNTYFNESFEYLEDK